MADNYLIAKWNLYIPDATAEELPEQRTIQFFKDGSCLIPTPLLGIDDGAPVFLFYQAFENGTIKLEPGTGLFYYKIEGEYLVFTSMDNREFRFVKEAKKSILKGRAVEAAPKPVKEEEPEREPEAHEWKCPNCGKINQNYVGTCGCGEAKPKDKPAFNWAEVHPDLVKPKEPEPIPEPEPEPEEPKEKKPPVPEREPEAHEWKCPNCGKINQNYVGTCGCGEPKPKDKPAFNWAEVHPDLVKPKEPEPIPEPEPEPEEPKSKKPAEPEREPEAYEWKCPNCGKINQNYVGTCGCGEPKPKDKPAFNWAEVHPELKKAAEPEEPAAPVEEPKSKKAKKEKEEPAPVERVAGENEWKCPNCGKINMNYVGCCGCGERKPAPTPAPAPAPTEEPAE